MAKDDKDRAGERDEDLFGRAERDASDAARRIDRDGDPRFRAGRRQRAPGPGLLRLCRSAG